MKKLIALLCCAVLVLGLVACGGSTSTPAVEINTVDDLNGKTVGVQQGTTGDIYMDDSESFPDTTVERFNKGADAVMALQQGKVDAVVIDDQPAKVYVEQNDDIRILEEPFEVEDYAICVAKGSNLTAQMNAAISELKNNGTLQALMDYYIEGKEDAAPYESPADVDRSNGTLIMATNAAFPPYEYWEGEDVVGLDADFARAICDILGYELKIEDMDFDSIITAVSSGKADFGAAGMTVTEDRLQSIDFTDSYCTATQVIIVRK